jgi:hypothetical protein
MIRIINKPFSLRVRDIWDILLRPKSRVQTLTERYTEVGIEPSTFGFLPLFDRQVGVKDMLFGHALLD